MEARHSKIISQRWLLLAITIQLLAIAGVFVVFLYLDLYHFKNGDGKVTPLLFYDRQNIPWWYFEFSTKNLEAACNKIGVSLDGSTCQTLNMSFLSNTVLNSGFAFALIFTICAAIFIVLMFKGRHYRYTNALMLASSLDLLSSMAIWFYLSGVYINDVRIGPSFYIIISVSILQLICYIGCRYFTSKLYDARLVKYMLQNDDESELDDEMASSGDEEEPEIKTEINEGIDVDELESEEELEMPDSMANSKKELTPVQLEKMAKYQHPLRISEDIEGEHYSSKISFRGSFSKQVKASKMKRESLPK